MLKADSRSFKEINYTEFGIFSLHLTMLNNNKLLVKYSRSFAPVPQIRQTKISNIFKYLIIDLLDTQKINIDLQKQLNESESDLLELLLTKSKTIGLLDYKRMSIDPKKLINTYKTRLTILQGSFGAGNENVEIIDESKALINKLHQLNEISLNDYNILINDF